MWKSLVFLVVIGNLALAQDSVPVDVSQWFVNTAALAAVVASLVAFLRKHVLKSLDGLPVVAASVVLGGALGYIGKLLGYLDRDWLLFGLSAGLIASSGIDLMKSMRDGNNGGSNASAGDTHTDADRARLR